MRAPGELGCMVNAAEATQLLPFQSRVCPLLLDLLLAANAGARAVRWRSTFSRAGLALHASRVHGFSVMSWAQHQGLRGAGSVLPPL